MDKGDWDRTEKNARYLNSQPALAEPLKIQSIRRLKIMTRVEIENKIQELQEWEDLMEQAKEEVEAIRDSLKAELLERNIEELETGRYIIRWTSVLTNRFDTKNFKERYSDLYQAFTKQSASKRFSISA